MMEKMTKYELKKHFFYEKGSLYWLIPTASQIKSGMRAGRTDTHGYRQVTFKGKPYLEHRLIWLYHYGVWPKDQIDHINHIRNDNRIENLREATNQQNQFNRRSVKGSSSVHKGVYWYPNYSKWLVKYTRDGKQYHVGYFTDELEAAKAYKNAVKNHQGDYKMENTYNG